MGHGDELDEQLTVSSKSMLQRAAGPGSSEGQASKGADRFTRGEAGVQQKARTQYQQSPVCSAA